MTPTRIAVVLVALTLVLLAGVTRAQQQPTLKEVLEGGEPEAAATAPPALPAAGPVDDLDRGVPRTSVESYLKAARAGDWERAAEYLDLRNLPRELEESEGAELARDLKVVLDRSLWVDLAALSPEPQGDPDDGLPSYRDRVGVIDTPAGKVEVLVQRVPRGDGAMIWKFSNRTVGQIPALYETHGYGRLVELLVDSLPEVKLLGIDLWQWVGMLALLLLGYLLTWLITRVISRMLQRRGGEWSERSVSLVNGPVRLLLFVLIVRQAIEVLAPSLILRAVLSAQTLLILAVAWALMRTADLLFDRLLDRLTGEESSSTVFVRPLKTVTRVVVTTGALVVWLDNVGFNVGTLLAGLGIGGLALALAAQKSVEDVFGAITLYSGRPVKVGDFCRFGTRIGTVMEIGLRWTRVRTLDDTVVAVPNGEFAKQPLENYSERRRIWYHPRLRLRYETTPEQLRYVLVEVRRLLYAHPRVLDDPARIRFVGFGEQSLDLDVFAYVDTQNYGEYLEIAEDLSLRIMEVVTRAGSGFALPAQITYLETGAGIDAEQARAAEAHVGEWRERGELYLPSFPDEQIAALRGSLPYPPEGAPVAAGGTR
jgi:MscS family membrane protein